MCANMVSMCKHDIQSVLGARGHAVGMLLEHTKGWASCGAFHIASICYHLVI